MLETTFRIDFGKQDSCMLQLSLGEKYTRRLEDLYQNAERMFYLSTMRNKVCSTKSPST